MIRTNEKLIKELNKLKGNTLTQTAEKAKFTFEKHFPIQSYWLDSRRKALNMELRNGKKAAIKFRKTRNKNEIRVIDYEIKEE